MRIERLCKEHLGAVAALERECFSEPWSEQALQWLLSDEAIGFVCLQGDCVVAYGGMLWAPGEGQITNIATAVAARRCGCGRAVLHALIEAAKERAGCESIALEVRASNTAAIALYEAEGFSVLGRRKGFYRHPVEDALVMAFSLTR